MWGKILAGATIASTLVLTACGGGGSSDSKQAGSTANNKSTAYFVDNAVIGLRYKCGADADFQLTGEQGILSCAAGETVSFYVGDLLLGEVTMAAGTSFVTPLSLATSAAGIDENMVANIARLLISIDVDQDPDNGIQIDPATHLDTGLTLDFTLDSASFETAVSPVLTALTQGLDSGPFTLVSADDAEEHLVFGLYLANAGYYEGVINRAPGVTSKMAFLVSRFGAAYGVNLSAEGMYAAAAFDEGSGAYELFEDTDYFKIDGDTGATLLLDVSVGNGQVVSVGEDEYPNFTATRQISYDPLMNVALLEAFNELLPVAIDLKGNEDYFVLDNDAIGGMFYGAWEGSTPNAEDPSKHTTYWFINYADVVSAKDGVLKLIALSTNGYLVEVTADFTGEEPVITSDWRQLHEGDSGSTSSYIANYEYPDEESDSEPVEEPVLLNAPVKSGASGFKQKAEASSGYWH